MTLTLILGDQLHRDWFSAPPLQLDSSSRVLMIEDLAVASAYRYHKLRLLHTFVAMRSFRDALRAQVVSLGLSDLIRFKPAMPGREALSLGRVMVVPSRAESLPYVVLEAAAGSVPLIATAVGGIGEIFGPQAAALLPPGDAGALAGAIARKLDDRVAAAESASRLRERVAATFSIETMVDGVLAAYHSALEVLHQSGRR